MFDVFATKTFNPRNITAETASYTVLATDEEIDITAAAASTVMTLPALNSFQQTTQQQKVYYFKNTGAYSVKIQPGTNSVTGTADTIGGKATYLLMPNENIFITGYAGLVDWLISSPTPKPALTRVPFAVVAQTAGTTATPVNVFDANGAPCNLDITEVLIDGIDVTTSVITLAQGVGGSTIAAITKGTTANAVQGAGSVLVNTQVAAGASLVVYSNVSSGGGGQAVVTIFGTMQSYV